MRLIHFDIPTTKFQIAFCYNSAMIIIKSKIMS